jgi:PAS domain S-box-containing protein
MDPTLPGSQASSAAVGDELFEAVFESSPLGVLVVGPAGTIARVNAAIERQFGYPRDELVGQPVERLIPAAVLAEHTEDQAKHARGAEPLPLATGRQLHGRRKDGSKFLVDIDANSIRTDRGVLVVASVADLSDVDTEHRKTLNEIFDFELLVSQLSSSFINLALEEVDDAIRRGQRTIVEALGLDRSTLFQCADDDDHLVLTHHWDSAVAITTAGERIGRSTVPVDVEQASRRRDCLFLVTRRDSRSH